MGTPAEYSAASTSNLEVALSTEQHQDVITGIPREELRARRERLLTQIRSQNLTGYVLFDEHYIQYFTSFSFLATERPVAFAANASGAMVVFVPGFEVERVHEETEFEHVESYPEYPGVEHPMLILGRVLRDMGITGAVGADNDGYPGILGYAGPPLSEVVGGATTGLSPFIESLMVLKSDAEIALIALLAAGRHRSAGQLAGRARGHAADVADTRLIVRRAARILRRGVGGISGTDRATQRLGARHRAQHRVPAGRRARDGNERTHLGLQRGARADPDHRPADRRGPAPV
jgi:hypothetical protein